MAYSAQSTRVRPRCAGRSRRPRCRDTRPPSQPSGAGWWSSDASHYFHTVTYHLDLVAALQSRGLGAAAAEALLESRPLFCFTAQAMALRDTDVWLQVRAVQRLLFVAALCRAVASRHAQSRACAAFFGSVGCCAP